jgi:transposase
MKDLDLFQAALGLGDEWFVEKTEFQPTEKRLDIYIDFKRGSKFPCPVCQTLCGAYDAKEQVWQHLNFFQYKTYLHAFVPRVTCKEHGVKQINIPWARERSGFTLLFEAMIMALVDQMPVKDIADMVEVEDTRLWRIIEHYVNRDLERSDLSAVRRVGVDETSSQKGHKYVSLFVDLDTKKVIFVAKGKDSSTVQAFKDHLIKYGGSPERITDFSCDLSPAFISGVESNFPRARITFDKFHVMKLLNAAVDETRRNEQVEEKDLKKTRYIWLKNPENLTKKQKEKLASLSSLKLKTGRAYRMKLVFQQIFSSEPVTFDRTEALQKWYQWAIRSRIAPIVEFAKTLKRHWEGITRWFVSKINNAILEGLNSLVQAAKARARGFRSIEYFKLIIYRVAGKMGYLPI